MDFQHQRYMRPPAPPSMADQHHYQQPPPPPAQSQPPWFSGQFQYHPSQHSTSPPPPHQQWAPPPQSDHLPPSPYHAPPHPPYPVHSHQYPPPPLAPRPHLPPPHPHPHVPQSYPQVNREWGNPNWSHHQGWEYSAHNHEEDLAARARAWAAANAATDNQHSQSQFTPAVGRPEEHSQYHSHYPQNVDPHYSDTQQSSLPSSNYQPYPSSSVVAPPHRTPVGGHPQDSASFSSGYLPQDGNLSGDANTSFQHRESSSTSLSVHQQEVPSSYSSVAGKEEAANQSEKFYSSMPLPLPQHYAAGRSIEQQPHYSFANQSAQPATDLSDQPLDFAPRPHMPPPPNYTHAWTPTLYPPLVDPAASVASSAPMFGRMPGPGFQSAIPSVTAPFGMGAGTTVHPSTVFPVDAYGVSERPKKASVPNWLREEIIKNKPVITSAAPELSKEEAISFEDEGVDDKSSNRGDQANSKTVDSSRSTEEEDDDDEDYVEAARTAAINQEIKRVLTEVLLKVTDELFDEIATKVLNEHDDLTVEVKHDGSASVHTLSPSTPSVQTPKVSAKILIPPPKAKGSHSDDVIEKSTSSSPGDVLGLGNYASDEDEDDAIQSSDVPNPKGSNVHHNPNKHLEDTHVNNGVSKVETEKHDENKPGTASPNMAKVNLNGVVTESSSHGDFRVDSADDKKGLDVSDVSKSKNGVADKVFTRTEPPAESSFAKKSKSDDSESRETRNKRDKNDRNEKRSSSGKEIAKEDDHRKRQSERHARKEKTNDQNGPAEKRSREKVKDSDSGKKSAHLDSKEDRKDIQRERRSSGKESNDRKRERTKDDKGERSRHKYGNDSSRHKRRRSSSSSDGSSDDSKRKVHSERRKSSPSPVRSRRRQVSRSPHSKHSQRRHSPYSSLETTRGRRSRSRSPVHRQR